MNETSLNAELREAFFAVIRAGMNQSFEPHILSEKKCKDLISIGSRHSILPIVYNGLKCFDVPNDILKLCDSIRLRDTKCFILQEDALKNICTVLDSNHIPYVLLKGAVLRHIYPEPEFRTCCDIDVLVKKQDLYKAIAAIEGNTDLKMQRKSYHDVLLANSNVHIELHFSLKENVENIDRLLKHAWEYATPVGDGCSRYTFTPEFLIFHEIAHMSYHFINGGLGIRPILDLWLLRNKTDFDETTVRQMCSSCGIIKFYDECCNLSEVWLGSGEHTETTKLLEAFCLSGGVYGSAKFRNAGRQRKLRGWKYVFSRIFPPIYQVKEFYSDDSGKKHTIFYYYWKRLLHWFRKNNRAELQKQLNDVLSSDKDYLDTADELFKQLEL